MFASWVARCSRNQDLGRPKKSLGSAAVKGLCAARTHTLPGTNKQTNHRAPRIAFAASRHIAPLPREGIPKNAHRGARASRSRFGCRAKSFRKVILSSVPETRTSARRPWLNLRWVTLNEDAWSSSWRCRTHCSDPCSLARLVCESVRSWRTFRQNYHRDSFLV